LLLNLPSDSNSYSSVSTFSDYANHTSITGAEIFFGIDRQTSTWELRDVIPIGNPASYGLLFDGNHYFIHIFPWINGLNHIVQCKILV